MDKTKLNTISDKAADRLLELLAEKASTIENADAIKNLATIIINIQFNLLMNDH